VRRHAFVTRPLFYLKDQRLWIDRDQRPEIDQRVHGVLNILILEIDVVQQVAQASHRRAKSQATRVVLGKIGRDRTLDEIEIKVSGASIDRQRGTGRSRTELLAERGIERVQLGGVGQFLQHHLPAIVRPVEDVSRVEQTREYRSAVVPEKLYSVKVATRGDSVTGWTFLRFRQPYHGRLKTSRENARQKSANANGEQQYLPSLKSADVTYVTDNHRFSSRD